MRQVASPNRNPMRPRVDYQDARHGYFIHAGCIYAVETAPSDVFRAAVLQHAPAWRTDDERSAVLMQSDLDFYDRFWLLNELAYADRAIRLYTSRECAEQS